MQGTQCGGQGCWRTTDKLHKAGRKVNHRQAEHPWPNDASCVRLRPQHMHHLCACDFATDRAREDRQSERLTIIGEYNRVCLAINVLRRLRLDDVLFNQAELYTMSSPPERLHPDYGPEFTSAAWQSRREPWGGRRRSFSCASARFGLHSAKRNSREPVRVARAPDIRVSPLLVATARIARFSRSDSPGHCARGSGTRPHPGAFRSSAGANGGVPGNNAACQDLRC